MSAIVLTGGGTAGHVTACLAMLDALERSFDAVHYIGSEKGIERELVAAYPSVVYHPIACAKLRRSLSPENLVIPFVLARGTAQARKLLREIAPDVIFSKGGYVSLPVVRASGKIPVVLHESDRTPGLANRLARRRATVMCSAFPIEGYVRTGAPIRPSLYRGSAAAARARYGLTRPVLLVTGGSLGAASLNATLRAALPRLTRTYDVLHLTGRGKADPTAACPHYTQIEYAPDPADLFAVAELVLTRGGANTLFELAALQKPMLIVPLARGSRGDQIENAAYFAEKGLARTVAEDGLTAERLADELDACLLGAQSLRTALKTFSADGTDAVVRQILLAAGKIAG